MLGCARTALGAALLAGCVPTGPACPPLEASEEAVVSEAEPAFRRLGYGSAELQVVTEVDGTPTQGALVAIRCSCITAPVYLRTNRDGLAVVEGLPPGSYEVASVGVHGDLSTVALKLPPERRFTVRLRVDEEPPPSESLPMGSDALPANVMLRLEVPGCFGASCRGYTADLLRSGEVTTTREAFPDHWRLRQDAQRFALERARCLARSPNYVASHRTEGRVWSLWVRQDDEIVVYRYNDADARAPVTLDEVLEGLERALGTKRMP